MTMSSISSVEWGEVPAKPHKCGQCGLAFALDTTLSAHRTIEHQDDPPHNCSVCNIAFFDASAYGTHILKHSLEKVTSSEYFQCSECSLEYPTEHGLRVHISKHTGVTLQSRGKSVAKKKNLLVCHFCPAMMKGVDSLREHLKIHNTVRPYECEQCHASFRLGYQFEIHKRRHQELKDLPQEAVEKYFSQVPFGRTRLAKKEKKFWMLTDWLMN